MDKASEATIILISLLRAAGVPMDPHTRAPDVRRVVDLILDAAVEEARNERKGIANQRRRG
jgi:hypothetical protein